MLRFFRQLIIDTLGFSKSEANGTLILAILLFVVAVLPKIYMHNTLPSPEGFNKENSDLKIWADELNASLVKKKEKAMVVVAEREVKSFPFDPNMVSREQLVELGFSERVAGNLVNYREHGGSFKIKSDLKKIYGISEERVEELWGQIQLPESYPEQVVVTTPVSNIKKEKEEILQIELNSVNEAQLQEIRGIGVKLSARIIKFRDLLGGFHSLDQLDEVYGLNADVLESLKEVSSISGTVNTVNINTDSANHLYNHPYIDYNIAYAIVNYHAQHGDFDSVTQLKSIKIISDSLYQKIYPYLSLNQ